MARTKKWTTEYYKKYRAERAKERYKNIMLHFNIEKDKDIIEYLSDFKRGTLTNYIRTLITQDMKEKGKKVPTTE